MEIPSLARRLLGTVRSSRFEQDLDAEMRHHLELEVEKNMRRGMTPAAARIEARRAFGSVAGVKDECRDSWGVRSLDALVQDLRFGARHLLKHPAYTLIVVLTLALGIGANTAIFSVVRAVLLRGLPYASGDRLVELRQDQSHDGLENIGFSAKEVEDYRNETASLDAVVEYHQMAFNLLGRGEASRVQTGVVSADFFNVIGVAPLLGRTFVPSDDTKGAPPVLVLSYAYWQNALGGDPNVIGRTFEMNDRVHTVVGVLPPVPQYPQDNDVYMPVSACPFRSAPAVAESRTIRMVSAIARLKPGASLARGRNDLAVVAGRLHAAYPEVYRAGSGFTTGAVSVREELTRRARPTLLILLAATAFVLLLVCANVANLTLARLIDRDRELTLRAALGAGRWRIVRQLLTESVLLASAGGLLGLAFASAVRQLLVTFTARFTPRASEIQIDPVVLLFALGVSLACAVIVGLVPAIPRRSETASGLKEGHRTVHGRTHARELLIAAQVAISFVLLVGAGLMVRSFVRLQQVDTGFSGDHVLTMRVNLDWVKYDTAVKRRLFFKALGGRVAAQPGVKSAGLGLIVPLDQGTAFNTNFLIEGQRPADNQARPKADFRLATPDYFQTIGMAVLRGRPFTDHDDSDSPGVVIVNASLARHYFARLDPIGRRVSVDNGAQWLTVVGEVNDVRDAALDEAPADQLYFPLMQSNSLAATVFVRTVADPKAAAQEIRNVVRGLDPAQPLSRIETLDDVRSAALASPKLTTILIGLFAVIALLITAAGIAGVVAFSVTQRTSEIGVRMALGAPAQTVVRMLVREGLRPVAIGLGIGLAGALLLSGAVSRLLFEVRPTDPPTFAAVALLLAAVAGLACLAPARRAAGVDPMTALRSE